MPFPKTQNEALIKMRFMWLALLIAIPLYIYSVELGARFSWLDFRNAGKVFAILAAFYIVLFFSWQRKRFLPSVAALRAEPTNIKAINKRYITWVTQVCLAESVAVCGVAFNMGGKGVLQSSPLYVIGFVLTLAVWPDQVGKGNIAEGASSTD